METQNVAWEDLMDEKSTELAELPQELRDKIAQYDECYDEYCDLDETDSMILELEVKLTALDDGICNDLNNYLSKREQILAEQQTQSQAQGQPQGNTDAQTQANADGQKQGDVNNNSNTNSPNNEFGDGGKTSSSKPTWRFW
jgi:hypothetical protein